MLTLFEHLDKGILWRFPGGIHPPECKTISNQSDIARLPETKRYIIPIADVGENSRLTVSLNDIVDKGQTLTVSAGSSVNHVPVHTPVSGKVVDIAPYPSNHPSGLDVMSCVIENDYQQRLASTIHPPISRCQVNDMTREVILEKIARAGIVGLGGAQFPTHIKLSTDNQIELLIINGVECEPYISTDDRLMRQYSEEIIQGVEIIYRLLKPDCVAIAIEDNKPEAIEKMSTALRHSSLLPNCARVVTVPTLYPSGGEKQLIQIITGLEVPQGEIPIDLGVLVQNVGTVYSIEQAVYCDAPLIERVVTLTGSNMTNLGNYWIPIGTPVIDILRAVEWQGSSDSDDKVIIGGPMMGYMLPNLRAPLVKGSNCILTPAAEETSLADEGPCIRCGECARVCPAQLLPQQLFWHAKAEQYQQAASYHLKDCIECGCCSYVCPSDISLVQYFRVAKSALRAQTQEQKQTELSKQRFDSRTLRLEQEKLAREEKAKQAAQRREAAMSAKDKDMVAAAITRAKAKKEAASSTATSTSESSNTDDPQQKIIAAAIARAKAKKAAKQKDES